MQQKEVVIEGTVSMVSVKGMGVVGIEIGTEDEWKVRLGAKEVSPINDWPLGSRVKITIEVVP